MADWETGGFGLYIHWPFCEAKCPYCDFNSHVAAKIDQSAWRQAYLSEIQRIASETPDRVVQSVFFGGGTPSLMAPETVAEILESVQTHWPVANDIEVTLEANPSSVEKDRFAAYRAAGVTRVSIGVQALNDADLKRLGRLHSGAEAREAIETAQTTFDRMSFDLIYARQGQSLSDWRAELTDALCLGADHLSLYQLTIEPGTAFGARHAKGMLRDLPNEDLSADMYELTQELCEAAGKPAYETSNHAGDMGASRHNLIYWRSGDWAGIGPGAHGRLTIDGSRYATETPPSPSAWLTQVHQVGHGEAPRHALTPIEHGEEMLMMGLRLTEGVSISRFRNVSGVDLSAAAISELSDLGLISLNGDRLATTAKGRPVLNGILRQILA
ncbi:radical SAM family heme chaperone HemW [Gymnodinialimonas sp. 2305UL16-5]|uniref:radical SAM family heme chaperone HemW n=1 Tax=Gymnodinialimonas mytili TaxID=3126503 RepID=UPI0030B6E6D2